MLEGQAWDCTLFLIVLKLYKGSMGLVEERMVHKEANFGFPFLTGLTRNSMTIV